MTDNGGGKQTSEKDLRRCGCNIDTHRLDNNCGHDVQESRGQDG